MAVTVVPVEGQSGGSSRAGSFGRDGGYKTALYAAATAADSVKMHDNRGFSGASVLCSASTTLTFYGAFDDDPLTIYPIYRVKSDLTVEALVVTTGGTNRLIDVPAECWSFQYIGVLAGGAANVRFAFKK